MTISGFPRPSRSRRLCGLLVAASAVRSAILIIAEKITFLCIQQTISNDRAGGVNVVSAAAVMKSPTERERQRPKKILGDRGVGSTVTGVQIQQLVSNRGPEWKHLGDSFVPAVWRVWKGTDKTWVIQKGPLTLAKRAWKNFYGRGMCSITWGAACRHPFQFALAISSLVLAKVPKLYCPPIANK